LHSICHQAKHHVKIHFQDHCCSFSSYRLNYVHIFAQLSIAISCAPDANINGNVFNNQLGKRDEIIRRADSIDATEAKSTWTTALVTKLVTKLFARTPISSVTLSTVRDVTSRISFEYSPPQSRINSTRSLIEFSTRNEENSREKRGISYRQTCQSIILLMKNMP